MPMLSNKALEPTAGNAASSASRFTVWGRLWLSFGVRPHHITMNKRTLFIGSCGNLLIALAGIFLSNRGFHHLFGAVLYLNKRERFPDGIDSWVMADLSGCMKLFAWLFGVLFVLLVFNGYLLFRILRQKRTDDHVV
jgi:hypothetical protein